MAKNTTKAVKYIKKGLNTCKKTRKTLNMIKNHKNFNKIHSEKVVNEMDYGFAIKKKK